MKDKYLQNHQALQQGQAGKMSKCNSHAKYPMFEAKQTICKDRTAIVLLEEILSQSPKPLFDIDYRCFYSGQVMC